MRTTFPVRAITCAVTETGVRISKAPLSARIKVAFSNLLDTGCGISHDTGDRYGQVGGNIGDRVLAACVGGEGVSVHGHYGDGLVIVCVQGEGEGEAVAFGYRMRSGCRGGGGSYQGREGYGIGSGLWRRRRYGRNIRRYGNRGRGERRGRGRAAVSGYGGGN